MSKKMFDLLRSNGIQIDDTLYAMAEQQELRKSKKVDNTRISKIELIPDSKTNQFYTVVVTLSTSFYQNLVFIKVDGNEYQAARKSPLSEVNKYYATIFIDLETALDEDSKVLIRAYLKNPDTGKVMYEKDGLFELKTSNSQKEKRDIDEKEQKLKGTGLLTYHIFWNNEKEGRIEKHIPTKISNGYENKVKYVYHDKNKEQYEIATLEFHEIQEKSNGKREKNLPSGNTVLYDQIVDDGQTERRVIFINGDIAEYGTNDGKEFWVIYKALKTKTLLVRMPDSLNIKTLNIGYNFSQTQRRYCHPDCFAGFIGALAEIKRIDLVSSGMCFKFGSSFPSVSHPNGDSIDTKYFKTREEEQEKIDAFKKFFFTEIIAGNIGWYKFLKCKIDSKYHRDHLHCGNFSFKSVITK